MVERKPARLREMFLGSAVEAEDLVVRIEEPKQREMIRADVEVAVEPEEHDPQQ